MNTQRVPFNGLLYGIFQLILLLSIIPGVPKVVRYAALPILVSMAYHLIAKTTTGDFIADVGLGSAILTQFITQLDTMFLADTDTLVDYYNPQTQKITEQPWTSRILWAFNLYINPRGIGWAHESWHTPSRHSASTPRWTFVSAKMWELAICIALEGIAHVSNASNPGLTNTAGSLSAAPFFWKIIGLGSFALGGFARINAAHCLLSTSVVGVGYSTPDRWPNAFGSPLDAWCIRQFWRVTWHQMLRKPLKAHASIITTKVFRFSCPTREQTSVDAGALARKLVWLSSVFFVTGLIHLGGEYMITNRLLFNGVFKFFMLQPLGIAVEQIVEFAWTRFVHCAQGISKSIKNEHQQAHGHNTRAEGQTTCPKTWIRCIGYLWVILWFSFSLPFMIDAMVPTAMFVDSRVDLRRIFQS